ncbi:Glutaredoxin-C8 [Orobanche gracilis]
MDTSEHSYLGVSLYPCSIRRILEIRQNDGGNIQDALSEIVGRRTVPQVFINGKHLGGSDDTVEAYETGELAKLLGLDIEDNDDL